jgi:hypothetical protein
MAIDLTHQFKVRIENSKTYQSLSGTNKFKQNLLSRNYKNIFHDYEQAKRLGVDYVAQYITSSIELKIIKELIEDDRNQEK